MALGLLSGGSGCVLLVNGKPTFTFTGTDIQSSWGFPTLSLSGGLMVSNGVCPDDLGKGFEGWAGGFTYGPWFVDDYAWALAWSPSVGAPAPSTVAARTRGAGDLTE